MTVSIVIPWYNAERWWPDCESSIRTSIYGVTEVNWELVVVHDNAGHGASWARNIGLSRATGDYIAWVDSDDEVKPEWAKEIACAVQTEPDVIIFNLETFGDTMYPCEWRYGRPTGDISAKIILDDVLRELRTGSYLFTKVIKSKLYKNLKFDESLRILEDYDLLPRVLQRAESGHVIAKSLYRYRQRHGSLLHGGSIMSHEDIWRLSLKRLPYGEAAKVGCAVFGYNFCLLGIMGHPQKIPDKCHLEIVSFVRRYLLSFLTNKEVPWVWKVKLFLLAQEWWFPQKLLWMVRGQKVI